MLFRQNTTVQTFSPRQHTPKIYKIDMKQKILNSTILIASIAIGAATVANSATVYSADFSVDGVGFDHDNANPPAVGPQSTTGGVAGSQFTLSYVDAPATDASDNFFITDGGILTSRDFGGAATFLTQTIDLTGLMGDATLDSTAETQGTDVFNAANEGFQWYYLLDGTRTDIGGLVTSDGDLSINETVDITGASTLQVGFDFEINGGGDGFDVSSVSVDVVPEPSTALLGALGFLALLRRRR